MIAGTGYFLGSVAVGGPLAHVTSRGLVVAGYGLLGLLVAAAL